jgi:hypothetical protein
MRPSSFAFEQADTASSLSHLFASLLQLFAAAVAFLPPFSPVSTIAFMFSRPAFASPVCCCVRTFAASYFTN